MNAQTWLKLTVTGLMLSGVACNKLHSRKPVSPAAGKVEEKKSKLRGST
ncbi:MAG: hypothetical protein HC902_10155 [Calothrix sp. SM1_5_4]|nr:hypothetical protein [Calothrix sp. SM1_5_4]